MVVGENTEFTLLLKPYEQGWKKSRFKKFWVSTTPKNDVTDMVTPINLWSHQ